MKAKRIVLSIVIPAYNAENTIVRALDSIRNHKSSQVVEVIVVNDGSKDKTKILCEEYISNNDAKNTIINIINQKNSGHGSAINYGIKNAKGKYLRVLDADDYLDSKNMDEYLEFLSKNNSDLVCSDYKEVNEKGEVRFNWHKDKKSFVDRSYDKEISKTTPYLLPCAAIRVEVLRGVEVLVDEKCYYDDQEYDLAIIQLCATVSYFAKPVYCYLVGNADQSISEKSLIKNIKDHQKVVEWLVRYYYSVQMPCNKKEFVFNKILVPLCHRQYFIATKLKKSREDFLSFDDFLKKYSRLYIHSGVAGRRLKLHRLTRGLFI